MRTVWIMAALVAGLSTAACGGSKDKEFDMADQQAIRQATTTLESSFNTKNVDGILAVYTDNSVFMPPNKPLLRGRGPLKGFYEGMLAAGTTDLKLSPADVAGHGPLAYESGSYSMTTGNSHDRGKYLFILRNLAGNWKIEYTSWSSDLPPAS